MRIKDNLKEVKINTLNWPLVDDLFVKWGYDASVVKDAYTHPETVLTVYNADTITQELSAWGIPWKVIDAF